MRFSYKKFGNSREEQKCTNWKAFYMSPQLKKTFRNSGSYRLFTSLPETFQHADPQQQSYYIKIFMVKLIKYL